MTYIPRIIENKINTFIKQDLEPYHVILLAGPRQCGKSTLLKHLFPTPEHIHVNLAEEAALCDAIDQTTSFDDFSTLIQSRLNFSLGSSQRLLIFDEAQLSKKMGNYVRFMKEKWQNQRVILTGSTLSQLFTNTEKPTGRVVEFVLRPFNFHEFLLAMDQNILIDNIQAWTPQKPISETVNHEIIRWLEHYLVVGGLPEVVATFKQGGDYQRLLANIFSFYKRDYESKLSVDNITSIVGQIYLRVAAATGSPLKLSSIIKSSSPGYKKIPVVLSLMEQWHQIIRVDCETSSFSKTGSVTPKRYIFDQGIRHLQNPGRFGTPHFLADPPLDPTELGGIIENFVLTELLTLDPSTPLRCWEKTHQSGQIDFVLALQNQTVGIEVKAAQRFNQKHLSSLKSFLEEHKGANAILCNLDRGSQPIKHANNEIVPIPAYCLWSYFNQNYS